MIKRTFIIAAIAGALAACSGNNASKAEANGAETSTEIVMQLTDSIKKLNEQVDELGNFSFQTNELAQQYFDELGIDNPSQLIINALMELNLKDKNPYIKSETNDKYLINNIRILNQKWVICNFSDTRLWGELLLEYHIDGNKNVTFKVLDELLHPSDRE